MKNTDVLMVIIYADVGFLKNFADNFTDIQELKKRLLLATAKDRNKKLIHINHSVNPPWL